MMYPDAACWRPSWKQNDTYMYDVTQRHSLIRLGVGERELVVWLAERKGNCLGSEARRQSGDTI